MYIPKASHGAISQIDFELYNFKVNFFKHSLKSFYARSFKVRYNTKGTEHDIFPKRFINYPGETRKDII